MVAFVLVVPRCVCLVGGVGWGERGGTKCQGRWAKVRRASKGGDPKGGGFEALDTTMWQLSLTEGDVSPKSRKDVGPTCVGFYSPKKKFAQSELGPDRIGPSRN